MNQEQYKALVHLATAARLISVSDLADKSARTLVYGYTCNRDTFHVYLKDGQIHKVVYTFDRTLIDQFSGSEIEPEACVPDKRIYPEACDYEFCMLLKKFDAYMPFTGFNENRDMLQQFHGNLLEELQPN